MRASSYLVVFLLCLQISYALKYESMANSLLFKAEVGLAGLNSAGMRTERIEDLINDSKVLLSMQRFNASILQSEKAIFLESLAVNNTADIGELRRVLLMPDLLPYGEEGSNCLDYAGRLMAVADFEDAKKRIWLCRSGIEKVVAEASHLYVENITLLSDRLGHYNITVDSLNGLAQEKNVSIDARVVALHRLVMAERMLSCLVREEALLHSLKEEIKVPLFQEMISEQLLWYEKGFVNKSLWMCYDNIQLMVRSKVVAGEIASIMDSIRLAEERRINVESPMRLLESAQGELNKNSVDNALALASSARSSLETSIEDDSFLRIVSKSDLSFNLRQFFINYWKVLVFVVLAMSCLVLVSLGSIITWNNKRMHDFLVKNETVLQNQIKSLQLDYFKGRKMGKETYELQIDALQEKLLNVNQRLGKQKERSKRKIPSVRLVLIKVLKKLIDLLEKDKFKSK